MKKNLPGHLDFGYESNVGPIEQLPCARRLNDPRVAYIPHEFIIREEEDQRWSFIKIR